MKWLQISSGRGPAECCWVVAQVVEQITKEAKKAGVEVQLIDGIAGDVKGTLKSALLSVDGENENSFIASWHGTIQWIGQSRFRPNHKRKNWFIDVFAFSAPEESEFDPKKVKVETLKAGGPGGQHVNKTDSAVRITYLPTGLSVLAREERSQFRNRKLAFARLHDIIKHGDQKQHAQAEQDRWSRHNELERGNPVRIYTGDKFRIKN